MIRFATKLLAEDEGERRAELLVLDDRGLPDLAGFIESPIGQVDPAVTDSQAAVGKLTGETVSERIALTVPLGD
jgi:hypothetical protein